MKFLLSTILIALLSFIAGLFLPWWSLAVVAFLVALVFPLRYGLSFLSGFLGVFILWSVLAWWIDVKNESLLSHKIALLFPLGGSSVLLIFVSAFIGGLIGGLAALSGSLMLPRKSKTSYKRKKQQAASLSNKETKVEV